MQEKLAFDQTDPNYLAVRQLFREYFGKDVPVDITVAHDDDMFAYSCNVCLARPIGAMAYFRAGLSIFDCVADVAKWKFGDFSQVGSFLDFACGHGRFTRVLAAVYPKERIWAAEILPSAVQFQSEQLGVHGLQSTTKPEEFDPGRQFDYIYVGSLFTHLPERTFLRWLRRLYDLLTPNGALAFTTHAPEHLPKGVSMPASGIYYLPSTEIPSLDTEDYGATMVTKEYMQRVIRDVTGNEEHWYQWRALGFTQDLWVLSKSPLPAERFVYDQGPQGHVDHCHWYNPTKLEVKGWSACVCPGHTIEQVRIFINGELCGTIRVSQDRPDVAEHLLDSSALRSGWIGMVDTPKLVNPWQDVFSAVATCSGGKHYSVRTVGACTVMEFPPGVMPAFGTGRPATTREKVHRALDYVLDGDWNSVKERTADLLRGR